MYRIGEIEKFVSAGGSRTQRGELWLMGLLRMLELSEYESCMPY